MDFSYSTRSGVDTMLDALYPGRNRGYWTSRPQALIRRASPKNDKKQKTKDTRHKTQDTRHKTQGSIFSHSPLLPFSPSCLHASHLTPHTSSLTPHTSASRLTPHTSHLPPHNSLKLPPLFLTASGQMLDCTSPMCFFLSRNMQTLD